MPGGFGLPLPVGFELPLLLAFVPMPAMGTDWGLLPALSTTVTVAATDPGLVGKNPMLIEHPAPGARLIPQLLLSVNWFPNDPVSKIARI